MALSLISSRRADMVAVESLQQGLIAAQRAYLTHNKLGTGL